MPAQQQLKNVIMITFTIAVCSCILGAALGSPVILGIALGFGIFSGVCSFGLMADRV